MVRCQLVLFVLISGCLIVACGGDDSSSSSGGGGGTGGGSQTPGQVVLLRGGERMAWDQAASTVQVARGYTYRLFIDGVQAAMTSVRCDDTRTGAGYECSGLLPALSAGQHTLEVAALSGAMQSASSAALLVRVGSSSSTGGAIQTSIGLSSSAGGCVATPGMVCYDAHLVASGLNAVTDLAWVPGERAFFIEDGERIREIRGDALTPQSALDRESPNSRIISLAAARDFDQTHLVFVGWSEKTGDGREAFHLTRYREVEGTLGEGATIVANLPMPANAYVPIGLGDQGLVYVALPAVTSDARASDAGGSVLRFDLNGAVPSTNQLSSPVVAPGYAVPSGLAWDRINRQMWLAGSDARLGSSVLTLPVSTNGKVGQMTLPALGFSDAGGDTAGSLPAIAISGGPSAESRLWLVQQPGRVYRGQSLPSGSALTRMPMDGLGVAQTITESPTGGLWVVTGRSEVPGQTSVWRLVPEAASFAAQ